MRKNISIILAFLLACVILIPDESARANELSNGDFGSGLAAWSSTGSTSVSSEEAVLTDLLGSSCGGSCASLFQGAFLAIGNYTLDFDFLNSLSATVPQGSFPDTVFASLYFTSDIAAFNPTNSATYSSGFGLFDLTSLGTTNVASGALVGASGKGGNWQHFNLAFNNAALQYVVVVAELFDFNGQRSDSTFRGDNFIINSPSTDVPEPASMILFGSGLLFGARRKGYFLQKKRAWRA